MFSPKNCVLASGERIAFRLVSSPGPPSIISPLFFYCFPSGASRDAQASCFQATVTVTTLLGQSRMLHLGRSPGSVDADGPEKDVQEGVKELLRLVLKITEVCKCTVRFSQAVCMSW